MKGKTVVYVCLSVVAVAIVSVSTWAACSYCKEVGGVGFTCDGIGSGNSCGVYWSFADWACCTDSITSNDCSDRTGQGTTTFYYKLTNAGTCHGEWLCSGSSSGCSGDVIVPLTHNCVTIGVSIPNTQTAYDCEA